MPFITMDRIALEGNQNGQTSALIELEAGKRAQVWNAEISHVRCLMSLVS